MTPRQRSCTGAALALLPAPVVFGLKACLPAPIGGSERSRIDSQDEGGLSLRRIDADFDGFDGIKKTWRDFGIVVRKHIDSHALYDGESSKLMRVEGRGIEIMAEFLEDLIDHDLG